MTLSRAFLIVVLTGVIFSGLGGALGWMLGTYSPEYYKIIFNTGNDPDFDPVQTGMGLGLVQGLGAGVAVAVCIILMLIWRESFQQRLAEDPDLAYISAARSRTRYGIVIWCLALVISVVLVGTVAFMVGALVGSEMNYQNQTRKKLDKLDEILKDNEYPDVTSDYSSAAQVYLVGTVKDQATLDQLRQEVILAFGTETADFMLGGVEVRGP